MATTRRRAQLVLLYGDAGVGKSRLASEIAHLARDELGARVLFGPVRPLRRRQRVRTGRRGSAARVRHRRALGVGRGAPAGRRDGDDDPRRRPASDVRVRVRRRRDRRDRPARRGPHVRDGGRQPSWRRPEPRARRRHPRVGLVRRGAERAFAARARPLRPALGATSPCSSSGAVAVAPAERAASCSSRPPDPGSTSAGRRRRNATTSSSCTSIRSTGDATAQLVHVLVRRLCRRRDRHDVARAQRRQPVLRRRARRVHPGRATVGRRAGRPARPPGDVARPRRGPSRRARAGRTLTARGLRGRRRQRPAQRRVRARRSRGRAASARAARRA